MSEALEKVYRAIDDEHAEKPAATRRQLVAGAGATLGAMGLLGLPGIASASGHGHCPSVTSRRFGLDNVRRQDPQRILNIAATAEVLATILNTLGSVGSTAEDGTRVAPLALPGEGNRLIAASAVQELGHYQYLVAAGGRSAATKIWIPNAYVSDPTTFLKVVEVGDQIFINAYLIATTAFAKAGQGDVARATAEIMATEAVHRAFARQLRGELGNDRMFMKFDDPEQAPGALNRGTPGFQDINGAVQQLLAAGFGFGTRGSVTPGRFYEFHTVCKDTPNPRDVNSREPE